MKRITLTAFLLASLLDLATTLYAVNTHGATVEANPLARQILLLHPLLYAASKAIVTTAGAAAILLAWHRAAIRVGMTIATIILALVAASNTYTITGATT